MEITAIKLDQLPPCPSQQQVQVFGVNTGSPSPPESKKKVKEGRKRKGPKGVKTYNCKWENDPLLKTWISRHPRDSGKVVCHFCQSVIRAHKNDLLEHTRTRKHMVNFCKSVSMAEYNQFIELSELRKETTNNRLSSPVDQINTTINNNNNNNNNNNTTLTPPSSNLPQIVTSNSNSSKFDQATITLITPTTVNGNSISHIYTTAGTTLHQEIEVDHTSVPVTTSLTPINAEDFNTTNICNVSCSNAVSSNCVTTSVPTFLNLTTSTTTNESLGDVLGDADDLWQESEDFISANSPSALVSVILEEQLSPTSNPASNNNSSNCKATLMSSQCTTDDSVTNVNSLNNMILSGISTNIGSLNVNLNLLDGSTETVPVSNHTNGENGTLSHGTNLCSINEHHVEHHETLLLTTKAGVSVPFTVTDILGAIEEGHFSFSDLCSLAKAATSQIDNCINGVNGTIRAQTNVTFCTTTSNGNQTTTTTIPSESLGILSPHGTHIHSMSGANTFSFKKDKSSRRRRVEHQLVLSKVDDL